MSEWICDGCCRRFDAAASQGATNTTVEEVRLRARLAAVEAERDAAVAQAADMQTMANEQEQRAIRAEAEVERLRAVAGAVRTSLERALVAWGSPNHARNHVDVALQALSTDAQSAEKQGT